MEKASKPPRAVKVLGSCLVPPEADTPSQPIWLSNLDVGSGWQFYTPLIYIFRNTNGDPGFFSPKKLKAALAKILMVFYPHAGTLVYDAGGRIELSCTAEGVTFVEATCDSTIDEFGDFSPSQELRSKLVPFRPSADPPCPVVMFQLTRFRCGGVCLGAAWHHVLGDGTSCFSFINSWAAVTCGVDPATIPPPYLDRTLLRARSPPLVEYDHSEHDKSYMVDPKSQQHHPAVPPPTAILRISKEQVARLKAGRQKGTTTFVAVVAHAWQCVCRSRGLAPDEDTRLFFAANVRDRVDPPLPPEYLGNAILFMPAEAKVRDLMEGGPESVAEKIRKSKARLHDRYLRSLIDFLEVREGPMKGPRAPPLTDLYVVSWQALPTYEADFGWGRPVFMGRAEMPSRGRLYINRSPEGDGGVHLAVVLEEEHMGAFKECFYAELGGTGSEVLKQVDTWTNKGDGSQLSRL